jgi:amidase
MTDERRWMDATAQAELVRTGEATPVELLEAAIERIEEQNPTLNAVIHTMYDKARAVAAEPKSIPDGPFKGVPFLIKDAVAHTAGDPYHLGMRALKERGHTASADTWLVERFRAAGFVICGKTNLPELATTITTEPLAYGPTRNPWNTARSAGGSSGGAGAAVASGMVPVAHGNDMGGSIRYPAAHCGLVGLKPTRARTTLGPDFGELWGPITHEHVLTRTVRDTAGVLDAIAGPGPGDPYTAPSPARPFLDEVGADPGRLRIAFRTLVSDALGESHSDVIAAVESAAALLESLGHQVDKQGQSGLDDPSFGAHMPVLFTAAIAREIDRLNKTVQPAIELSELEPLNALVVEMGRTMTAGAWLEAVEGLQAWSRPVVSHWHGSDAIDVLVLPVSPEPPLPIGELDPVTDDAFRQLMRVAGLTSFTFPFNVTGQPAISVPLHWNDEGLPIGVQLVAAQGREDILLRLASQLEQARPWRDRHPA